MQGTLRQHSKLTLKDGRELVKLWIEEETQGRDDVPELAIREMLLPVEDAAKLPAKGSTVSVAVRAYVKGRDVAFQGVSLVTPGTPGKERSAA